MKTITAKWFECSVRYAQTQEDGTQKMATEIYAVDALSFTEAEARVMEDVAQFINGDFVIASIKPAAYREVILVEQNADNHFYIVKVAFITLDEKTGKEKQTCQKMLVEGKSLRNALDNVDELLRPSMTDYVSVNASSTKIVDIFSKEK